MPSPSPSADDPLWLACWRPGESRDTRLARWQLARQVLGARTPLEVFAARVAIVSWLTDHPDDETILSAGEQLAMLNDWVL